MKITDEMVEAGARAMCEAWHYAPIGSPDGDAEWKRKQDQYRKQSRAALTAALAVQTQQGVEVKKLEWNEVRKDDGSRWRWVAGDYGVTQMDWNGFSSFDISRGHWLAGGPFADLEAAKAAAQADYETRIRSALVDVPAVESEPVGEAGEMPGSNGGFTMAAFKAVDVPVGTKLYAHYPLSTRKGSAGDGSATGTTGAIPSTTDGGKNGG